MTVESLKSLFDIGAVILLFLTFAFGAGGLITGNLINKRQAAQLREFQLEISQSNERSAEANEKAAEANETAERERLARIELQEKVAWRTLDKKQWQALISSLSVFAGQLGECSFLSSDMEAFSFSSEIATALRAAKWRVIPPNPNVVTVKETSLPTTDSSIQHIDFGVEVVSTSDKNGVAAAHAVAEELARLGFDAHYAPTPQHPQPSKVWITVQHRPLGPQGEARLRTENNRER